MNDLIKQFEIDLKEHLERTFTASETDDPIQRWNETEQKVFEYIDNYLLNTTLIAKDVEKSTQQILDEFIKEKIK